MYIGYVHVSNSDGSQALDLQKDALKEAGVEEIRIYGDFSPERKDDRPGLKACLKALQPGNALVVWKLDRLGRNLKHLIPLVEDLKNKKIGLKVLADSGAQVDTTTPNGEMMFSLFAVLAEFERELIVERTRADNVAKECRIS